MPQQRPLVVDTHTHFFPLSLLEATRAGRGPAGMSIERRGADEFVHHEGIAPYRLPPFVYDAGARLAQMDEDGIDVSLLAIVSNLFAYWLEPAETLAICQQANEDVAALAAQAPGRLFGLATVPLNDPEAAAAELRRAHGLGLVGVEIGSSVGDLMLDHPSLDPFFAAAEELGLPVMIHLYLNMMMAPPRGAGDFHLENVIGNPLETQTAGYRLILGGTLDRFPRLEVQLSHGGGTFPYQLARLDHSYRLFAATRAIAQKLPSEYLGQLLFDSVIFGRKPLEFLIDLVGSDRVVFGTDRIFNMADLLALEVGRDERPPWAEAVLGANAQRSYRLGACGRAPA